MHLVVYGDFNCPYSCLASARVDGLVDRGLAEVDWRGVEHDPSITAPSRPAVGDLAAMLEGEVDEVRDLLRPGEEFPIRTPPVQPNTRAALVAYAAADAAEAAPLRRGLFAALWFDGRDIGDEPTLRDLGGDPAGAGDDLVGTWRDEWLGLDRRLVPMLVLPDGEVSRGLEALDRLARLGA